MRRAVVALFAVSLLTGPLASLAAANPIQWIKENGPPQNCSEWQDMLGIDNVRECESP